MSDTRRVVSPDLRYELLLISSEMRMTQPLPFAQLNTFLERYYASSVAQG